MSRTIEGIRESLRSVGRLIAENGTPAATGPFVITVTGYIMNCCILINMSDSQL